MKGRPRSVHGTTTPPARSNLTPGSFTALAVALIVLVGCVIYSNSFRGVFVLDEQHSLVDNPNIRSIATAFSAPPDAGIGGRPVASLSFALNYALAPADSRDVFTPPPPGYPSEARELLYRNLWGYHAVNLAVHMLAALALFGVVRTTLTTWRLRDRFGNAATPLAAAVALLWLAHPLQTASVTYVAQRLEAMMGLFYLVTLYCAIRATEVRTSESPNVRKSNSASHAGARRPSTLGLSDSRTLGRWAARTWTSAAVIACALGAGCKEIIVTAPLVVVLYDWLFGDEDFRATARKRWPLYAGLASTWAVVGVLVLLFDHSKSVGFGVDGWTPWTYLLTQAEVLVHYLRLAVVPTSLVLDYDWPAVRSALHVLPQAALLVSLAALTAWGIVRRHPLSFLSAWFFLILAPSSSVLPIATEVAAEHRMYLPLAAVLTLAVLVAYARIPRTKTARTSAVLAAAVLVVTLGAMTYARNDDYSSNVRIWADNVVHRPDNWRARGNYGAALVEQGSFAEGEQQLRAAIAKRPDYPEAHTNLGVALCSQGRIAEGIEHFERAIELVPDYRDAWRNLAEAHATMGNLARAIPAYRKALATAPNDPSLAGKLAWSLATAPDPSLRSGSEAVALGQRAVALTNGADANSLDTLAAAYAEAGRFNEAVATAERAAAVAERRGDVNAAVMYGTRANLFRSRQPYRQGVSSGPEVAHETGDQ